MLVVILYLNFYDYDNGIQHFPVKVFPLRTDLSGFHITGKREISNNEVIINQSTANCLANIFDKNCDDLLGEKLSLYMKADNQRISIDFIIASIVEEDTGTYCEIFYDKDSIDKILKNTDIDGRNLFEFAYKKTGVYEVTTHEKEFEYVYKKLSSVDDYQVFNIEKAQNNDNNKMINTYKPYYIVLCVVYILFQYCVIVSDCQKDWKYHVGLFAIFALLDVQVKEIKELYLISKIKEMLFSILVVFVVSISLDMIFDGNSIYMILCLYCIVLMIIFGLSILFFQHTFKKENIALLIKANKEII